MLSASSRSRWSTGYKCFTYRIHSQPDRDSGEAIKSVYQADSGHQHRLVNQVEKPPAEQQSDNRVPAHFDPPFLKFQGSGFAGEKPQNAVAIERRKRQQVEAAEQDVEGEKDAQDGGNAFHNAARGLDIHDVELGNAAGDEGADGESDAHGDRREQGKREIGG